MATKKTLTTTSGLDPNIELVGGNGGVKPPATHAGDDTSRTIRTIAGNAYCLTLETGNVQISGSDDPEYTPDATIIFNADKQGQYVFIAISSWTHINIDLNTKYVINPLNFKVASLGASSGGGGDSFDPSASQTITGAWVFQSTLQRKTVASPALTDVMNSEMVNTALNSTVKLIGNQSIAGTKTFTGGVSFNGTANFLAGATRTTKATPADTDLMNKAMCDAAYSSDFLQYVKARGFANSSSTPSFIVSDLPKPSNMKIKLNPRRDTYNAGAKIQIPQGIVQCLQIVVDQSDGTVKYEGPTLVGTNLEITPKKGMSIEMTCLCSAGTATVCTCVGFNDYDVMGDAYFLSAIV
jgi:hypothetical protein